MSVNTIFQTKKGVMVIREEHLKRRDDTTGTEQPLCREFIGALTFGCRGLVPFAKNK